MNELEARPSTRVTGPSARLDAGVADDGRLPVRADGPSTPPRELARRSSGTVEVILFWHPGTTRVELCIRDLATDVSFHLEVAPASANDAFHHPFAYAARRRTAAGARAVAETAGGSGVRRAP
jgi:hypothetical protein